MTASTNSDPSAEVFLSTNHRWYVICPCGWRSLPYERYMDAANARQYHDNKHAERGF